METVIRISVPLQLDRTTREYKEILTISIKKFILNRYISEEMPRLREKVGGARVRLGFLIFRSICHERKIKRDSGKGKKAD